MRQEEEQEQEDAEEEDNPDDDDEEAAAGETAPTLKSATSSRTVLAPVSESGSDASADTSMDDTHQGEEESKGAEYSVFVGDLGQDVTEEVLTELFKTKCSTACNARIVVDLKTLKSKGYGFIDFKTEEDYNVAMEELPGTRVGASKRPIRISNAVERRTDTFGGIGDAPHDFEDLDPTNTTIFIGNLDVTVSGDELRAVFERFGDVAYVKVTPKKGCAFVHFYRRPQAKAAMDAVHGMKLGAKHVRLSWGRHNTTKCAISSMLNGGQFPQYLPSPMAVPPQPMYVPTPHMVPSVFTGMRMPMTSAASMYSMYGGMHVMPPPPPVPLVAPES
jgi:RNA recognition motif-containing protein